MSSVRSRLPAPNLLNFPVNLRRFRSSIGQEECCLELKKGSKMKKWLSVLAGSFLAAPLLAARPVSRPAHPLSPAVITRPVRLVGVAARRRAAVPSPQIAVGLEQNLAVVGRLVGGDGVLYSTAVDVQNNTPNSTEVDFYFNGTAGAIPIAVQGTIQNLPSGLLAGYSDAHYDDFIDALARADCGGIPCITQGEEAAGVMGSMLLVYNGFNTQNPGEGVATARFYRTVGSDACALAGGTIGVAAISQWINGNNPLQVSALFRDTRGQSNTPQLYPNMFINNMGVDNFGFDTLDTDVVELTAYANSNGAQVGVPSSITIGAGQTAIVSDVLNALQVPTSEDSIIVFAVVTGGSAALDGLAVEVDDTTRDGSAVKLYAAEFY
jgi:hypothetical protein